MEMLRFITRVSLLADADVDDWHQFIHKLDTVYWAVAEDKNHLWFIIFAPATWHVCSFKGRPLIRIILLTVVNMSMWCFSCNTANIMTDINSQHHSWGFVLLLCNPPMTVSQIFYIDNVRDQSGWEGFFRFLHRLGIGWEYPHGCIFSSLSCITSLVFYRTEIVRSRVVLFLYAHYPGFMEPCFLFLLEKGNYGLEIKM